LPKKKSTEHFTSLIQKVSIPLGCLYEYGESAVRRRRERQISLAFEIVTEL